MAQSQIIMASDSGIVSTGGGHPLLGRYERDLSIVDGAHQFRLTTPFYLVLPSIDTLSLFIYNLDKIKNELRVEKG